jgi:hypothetical protein
MEEAIHGDFALVRDHRAVFLHRARQHTARPRADAPPAPEVGLAHRPTPLPTMVWRALLGCRCAHGRVTLRAT